MKVGFALFMFLGLAIGLNGQIATTTALVGTVTDSTGSALVAAKITATEAATQGKYTTVTNQDGNYRIDVVRIGTYDVTAEYPGFKTMRHTGSVVDMNQVVRNDLTLSPGAVTESITVEAAAPILRTDDASVTASITTKQIADLPMNGRNVL